MIDLDIRPLTSENFADLNALFEERGPRGGLPTYNWCWCMYFRARGRTWSNSSPDANRDELRKLAEDGEHDGAIAPGLVAYRGGSAAGWVSLAPREDYERLAFSTMLRPIDDRPVWSIVCFVVGRHHRRQGVAAALLEAAIEYARAHGARTLEGYPLHESRGKVASSAAYVGHAGDVRTGGVHRRRTALLGLVIAASPDHAPRTWLTHRTELLIELAEGDPVHGVEAVGYP